MRFIHLGVLSRKQDLDFSFFALSAILRQVHLHTHHRLHRLTYCTTSLLDFFLCQRKTYQKPSEAFVSLRWETFNFASHHHPSPAPLRALRIDAAAETYEPCDVVGCSDAQRRARTSDKNDLFVRKGGHGVRGPQHRVPTQPFKGS